MKTYVVPTEFAFSGTFYVTASSAEEAEELVRQHCGATLRNENVQSTLSEGCVDWLFDMKAEKRISPPSEYR